MSTEREQFAIDLTTLMNTAMRLGLYRTGHRIHDAVRELGWELAGEDKPESEPSYAKTVEHS